MSSTSILVIKLFSAIKGRLRKTRAAPQFEFPPRQKVLIVRNNQELSALILTKLVKGAVGGLDTPEEKSWFLNDLRKSI
jgi:hypothetical protein